MKLRDDVLYVSSNTLTGRHTILGIPAENSFVKIPKKHVNEFFSFCHFRCEFYDE